MTSLGYPRAGERLGHFVVGRRIGGGGMGVVFEAHDEALDRQVAIKIISPHLADDPAFRERFIREARSLASLDSTHVVHVYAHGEATPEEGGRLYLVTQLIPDGDLGGLLQAYGAPPPAMALDLLGQIADGLADAHAAGLIHRDIKPANVLLRRRVDGNQAYLSDFGIARPIDAESSGTTTGTMGTPTYMAPELHLGDQPSVASDVYSLGCLLWAALTGRAPYAGTSDYQIVTAHLEQPVPQLDPSSELAVEANRILRTSMAKAPAERYPSAAAMRDDLRRAALLPEAPLGELPVEETTDEPAAAAPAGRPARAAVAAALAVVLVIAALGVWALTLRGDADDSTAGSDPPTAGPATTASSSSSTPTPSDSGSADPPADGDEEKAITGFAKALVKEGGFNQEQADCVARDVVTNVGLPALVAAGFFDENMKFLNPDLDDLPEIKSALTQATITCLA